MAKIEKQNFPLVAFWQGNLIISAVLAVPVMAGCLAIEGFCFQIIPARLSWQYAYEYKLPRRAIARGKQQFAADEFGINLARAGLVSSFPPKDFRSPSNGPVEVVEGSVVSWIVRQKIAL